jgi:hypothetical protein
MTQYTATIIDTTGIQPYIFNSNRLRENIGASYLVDAVTKLWVRESLQKLLGKHFYFPDEDEDKYDNQPYIENGNLMAEVVYAGGGNAVIIFQSHNDAVSFTKILSKRVLEKAPGLNLVVAHKYFDWEVDRLRDVIDDLIGKELDIKKQQRIPSAPLLGLGVTATCNSTQLPAIDKSDEFGSPKEDSYFVSREVKYKLKSVDLANKKLKEQLKVDTSKYDFPLRGDDLGRTKDESSYVAVVHADGNSMGYRFKKHCENISDNRKYIIETRKLSWSVNKIGIEALKTVVNVIINSITYHPDGAFIQSKDSKGNSIGKIFLKEDKGKIYLPFRPLVYGGDDVTFICDGRLGLTLAALFLQEFQKEAADEQILTACAGISIVKSHYPFARAYALSESLCGNAKKIVREAKEKNQPEFSVLDWHIAASGLIGTLSEIREREYQIKVDKSNKNLAMRPLRLKGDDGQWQNWQDFETVITEFITGEHWQGKRNKVMRLREVLRQGSEEATKQFLKTYRLLSDLPTFSKASNSDALKIEGWTDGDGDTPERICGYFDAIEAMEFYFPLSGVNQ